MEGGNGPGGTNNNEGTDPVKPQQKPPERSAEARTPPPSSPMVPRPPAYTPNSRGKTAGGGSPVVVGGVARPASITSQQRGVSWQPSSASSGHTPPRSRKQSYDLVDVLSRGEPHEMEAETQILRAVEKLTGQAHQRTATETSRLYNQMAHDEISPTLADDLSASNHQNKPPPSPTTKSPAHRTVPSSGGASTGGGSVTATPTRPPIHPGMGGKSRFRGLVKQTMDANNTKNASVEQTLFGLSAALQQMDSRSVSGRRKRESVKGDYGSALTGADKLASAVGHQLKNEKQKNKSTRHLLGGGDVEEGGGGSKENLENLEKVEEEDGEDGDPEDTDMSSGSEEGARKSNRRSKKKRGTGAKIVSAASDGIKADFELFNAFLGGKKKSIQSYARMVFFFMLFSLVLAGLLFYFVEEHETYPGSPIVIPGQDASPSWWILFIGLRVGLNRDTRSVCIMRFLPNNSWSVVRIS